MFSSFTKLLLKASLLCVLVTALSALALHIWFVNNARGILKEIVKEKSQGKFKVELSQLSFDFLSNTLQVRHADLSSTDTTNQAVTYHVKFNRLTLHVGSFWPLLLERNLVLDSIILQDPNIEVKQWRKDTSSIFQNEELSVPQEMGRMYHSMLDVLEAFGIRRIQINNAKLTLTNKMRPQSEPVAISDIYLNLYKTPNQSVKAGSEADQSQSIDLKTREQNIALPGGRHRLAFKNFHLQLFRKRIEMDSCTLTAVTTDSASSSYKIFFKKLMLTGVDFDAMYRMNLIKADSVYCVNPLFDIKLDRQKSSARKKERPDAEKIVRELTGDLDLAFVGVKHAGIRINIGGTTKRSLYNSNRDDFQMFGLKIDTDSSMPVSVDRFEMLVRDYHLYNQDSSAVYSFDSIHFVNNKIRLSNFSAVTGKKHNSLHNERDFKIKLFELSGLDWYELVFNETLRAREAHLYNPVIRFAKTKVIGGSKKRNFFSSLETLDDFMTLDKITVVNGLLDMKLSDQLSFNFDKVNFSLYTNKLLKSVDNEGIRDAVEYFLFDNGVVRFKDMTASLKNVQYSGSHLVHAGQLALESKDNTIHAEAEDVTMDNLVANEQDASILIDGLNWQKASVQLQSLPTPGMAAKKRKIRLKKISGKNTDVTVVNGNLQFKTFINSLSIQEFSNEHSLRTTGFQVSGAHLMGRRNADSLITGSYQLIDKAASFFTSVSLNSNDANDSIRFRAQRIDLVPDINSMLANNIYLEQINIKAPVLNLVKNIAVNVQQPPKKAPTHLKIDKFNIENAVAHLETHRGDSISSLDVNASGSAQLSGYGVKLDSNGLSLLSLSFNTRNVRLAASSGGEFSVGQGKVDMQLADLQFSSNGERPRWNALVNDFHISNPQTINLGKKSKRFTISEAGFGNIHLSSDYIANVDELVQKNLSAWLSRTTGEYIDSVNTLKWFNAGFNGGRLTVDSFLYRPTPGLDQWLSRLKFQKDYITLHTGSVVLAGFKPERYKKDSSVIADTMYVSNPVMTVFRDKLQPFGGGTIKPLPVDAIMNISRPVQVQTVVLKDGTLSYTEKNGKSRAEGTISLTHMQVLLQEIKNRNIRKNDSLVMNMNALLMDSAMINLRIKESYTDSLRGFLMTLKMRPTSLLFLNPVLTPLTNVKIISGNIDSLSLTAIGSKLLGYGKMNMYYKNLRIELVKDGNPDKKRFSKKMLSFLASTFVIKRNNDGRTGLVYFDRQEDRSFFNYIIKMTFSGMATSIGVKKNRSYEKEYRQQLRKQRLPRLM